MVQFVSFVVFVEIGMQDCELRIADCEMGNGKTDGQTKKRQSAEKRKTEVSSQLSDRLRRRKIRNTVCSLWQVVSG